MIPNTVLHRLLRPLVLEGRQHEIFTLPNPTSLLLGLLELLELLLLCPQPCLLDPFLYQIQCLLLPLHLLLLLLDFEVLFLALLPHKIILGDFPGILQVLGLGSLVLGHTLGHFGSSFLASIQESVFGVRVSLPVVALLLVLN